MLRVRFTIRRFMIGIAIIGLPLAPIAERERRRRLSESFESLAAYHESRTVASIACSRTRCTFTDHRGRTMMSNEVRSSDWHRQLAEKYRHAAARPWLPVEPDPLPPQP